MSRTLIRILYSKFSKLIFNPHLHKLDSTSFDSSTLDTLPWFHHFMEYIIKF